MYCFTTWFFFSWPQEVFSKSVKLNILQYKAEYIQYIQVYWIYSIYFLIADEIILFSQFLTFGNVDSFNLHFAYMYVFMCSQNDFFSSRSLLPAFFQVLSVWEWLFTCTLTNNDTKISFDDFKFQHFPFVYTYIRSYIHISYFSCPISSCWWDYQTNQAFVFKDKWPKKFHFHTSSICNQSTFFFFRQFWDLLSVLIFCHLGSTWCNL